VDHCDHFKRTRGGTGPEPAGAMFGQAQKPPSRHGSSESK